MLYRMSPQSGTPLDGIVIGMLVSFLHATETFTLGTFLGLALQMMWLGPRPPQPCIFELEFGNSAVGAARAIELSRCGLRSRRRLAPPVQSHDANAKCARNFALQSSSRRQFVCLRQLIAISTLECLFLVAIAACLVAAAACHRPFASYA